MVQNVHKMAEKAMNDMRAMRIDEVATNLNLEVTILPIMFCLHWYLLQFQFRLSKTSADKSRIQVIF